MNRTASRSALLGGPALLAAVALALVGSAPTANAAFEPGTPAKDIHIGLDNDNVSNPFIQPAGVAARQDTNDTDLLFGRGNADLLIGGKGADTLLGGSGDDILVGGPDQGSPADASRTDVLVGDDGDDVAVWSPGDGNDLVDGNDGTDTLIVGTASTNADGTLRLDSTSLNRTIPRVAVDGLPAYDCTLVPGSPDQQLGEYLLRFSSGGVVQNTLRLNEMERVVCPGPTAGTARVADLTAAYPTFVTVPLTRLGGLVGAIVAPVG